MPVDESELLKVINKLLDKAGKDPRLTPRILREKAEQRLSINKNDLKPFRNKIKDMIFIWWDQQAKAAEEEAKIHLKLLIRVAKVSGSAPQIFKGLGDCSDEERMIALRTRLREKGLVFSDIPTQEEIEKIQKEFDAKKDMEGIDKSLILDPSKKRKSDASEQLEKPKSPAEKKQKPLSPDSRDKKKKLDEEEAEF